MPDSSGMSSSSSCEPRVRLADRVQVDPTLSVEVDPDDRLMVRACQFDGHEVETVLLGTGRELGFQSLRKCFHDRQTSFQTKRSGR